MDFNIADYKKFIEVVSDSTLSLPRNMSSVVIVWKKNIHNYLIGLLKYSLTQLDVLAGLTFLHIFQQNNILQQTKGRSRQQNPAVYLLSQTFKKTPAKMTSNIILFTKFICLGK